MGIFVKNFPNNPLMKPMIPHEITCQIVQIPIPRIIFDKKVIKSANITAARGPNINPEIIRIDVTGCTFGINDKRDRPMIASAASNAINVNL